MLSFVYLASFLDDWTDLGLGEADLEALERLILERPEIGVVMAGTGGLRKVRFASGGGGKGKSSGERICYALYPEPGLVLMVVVFGKDEKSNLTHAERNEIKSTLVRFEARLRRERDA